MGYWYNLQFRGNQLVKSSSTIDMSGWTSASSNWFPPGVPGILAGAVGGDSGASHAGDGRAGAGKSQGNDMLNNAVRMHLKSCWLGIEPSKIGQLI
jgi:hypothetical protein